MFRFIRSAVACLVLIVPAAVGCADRQDSKLPESLLEQAAAALNSGDREEARTAALSIPREHPDWVDGQLLLAQISVNEGRPLEALPYLESIPRDGSSVSRKAAFAAAPIQESAGRLSQAIASYEYVLEHEPDNLDALDVVARLLAMTEQKSRADVYLAQLVRTPRLGFRHLAYLTDFDRRDGGDLPRLQRYAEQAPHDPAVQFALAVDDYTNGRLDAAQTRLQAIVAADPHLAPAQGLLGEVLLEEGDAGLTQWYRELPQDVLHAPEIWYALGLWAQQRGESRIAARCFWECARQTPTAFRPIHQLGRALSQEDPEAGQAFATQAEEIFELRRQLSTVLDTQGRDEDSLRRLIEILLNSGREWEAWSWLVLALDVHPRAEWLSEFDRQLADYPETSAPRIIPEKDLTSRYDLSDFPSFDQLKRTLDLEGGTGDDPKQVASLSFTDDAAATALEFVYHNGRVPDLSGARMQESTGGGVGVIDYDSDSRPDLFFTQGEDWPAESDVPKGSELYRDRLFRSRGTAFQDVTGPSRLPEEDGFGQGCSAGDFNSDGFPDLYIANIGANQLLINNGDGTFTDVTAGLGFQLESWTSSCLIADLNEDGNPDLYDVNYVAGHQLYRMICNESECSPEAYGNAADCVYLSAGEMDTPVHLLPVSPSAADGAGLGIVAFRTEVPTTAANEERAPGTRSLAGPLHLFVANDQDPNFLLTCLPAGSDSLTLVDEAFIAGVALNRDGRTTACMGVAAGDADNDGRLDLFVSNFQDETRLLFLQSEDVQFVDAVAGSGLMHPGLKYVGWGTQFLDADNDADLDLVVANGHVADFEKPGVSYRMPLQLFANRGNAQFQELPSEISGDLFARAQFGRSLATLDWNRDGRADFVMSPIGENVVLATNATPGPGNWLALTLHGTWSARDAVGTVVTVRTDSLELSRQLTGGDGYQASNERELWFGLADADGAIEVEIRWPSGIIQVIRNVTGHARWHVIESSSSGSAVPAPAAVSG